MLDEIEPAASVDLRAESRLRPAGQAEPDDFAAGEVELVAGAQVGFRLSPVALAIRYAPSLTFTSYDPLEDPLFLHQGMARVHVDLSSRLRLSAAHLTQHGERNFTAAVVHEEAGGRRLRLEFLPDIERLPITSHYTNSALAWDQGRWNEWRLVAGYGTFGGRGESARERLPRQSGPRVGLEGDVGLSGRDAVLGRLRASRTELEPGPTFLIGELDGGWRHNLDRRTSLTGFLGLFAGYNEEPVGDELRSVVLPTIRGEMTRTFRRGRAEGELEILVSARPWINQLEATLDPRGSIEGIVDWAWRESLEGWFEVGQAWVLDEDFSLHGSIMVLGSGLSYPLTSFLDVDGGMRLFRQRIRYGIGWWGPSQWRWDLYFALTFHSGFFEGR